MELKSGRLAGIGLDVLSNEVTTGINENNPLITYANEGGNIVFTPHIGGSTCEALSDTSKFISKKIINFLGYGKL
jgi:phosphoglycerate dehydrogenase-like enzyme